MPQEKKNLIYPLIAQKGGECEYNNGRLTVKCLLGRKRVFPSLCDYNALFLRIMKHLQVLQGLLRWLPDEKWHKCTQQSKRVLEWAFPLWNSRQSSPLERQLESVCCDATWGFSLLSFLGKIFPRN